MRAVAGIVLATVVLVVAGWGDGGSNVRHGSVRLARPGPGGLPLVVDVWHDTMTDEFAFRLRGDSDISLLRGRTIYDVTEGRLDNTTVYLRARDAWEVIRERFALTAARTTAALAKGETVVRPALMTVPKPDPLEYTYSRDFETNLGMLRRAAPFAVPSPGRRLDGRMLAHVSLDRNTPKAGQSDVAVIIYTSSSSSDDQALLNVAAPASSYGSSYVTFFAKSRHRIAGPGLDARITSDGDAILRYHGSYVLVRLDENASDGRWRAVLGQIARS